MNKAQATINGTKTRSGNGLANFDKSCIAGFDIAVDRRISKQLADSLSGSARDRASISDISCTDSGS
jgi:hypothetical protein